MVIYSAPYLLDIGSCMLENRELIRAMEFDDEDRAASSTATMGRTRSRSASPFPRIWPRRG